MIDTNIIFSGIIWSGPEARLLDMARSGAFTLLIPDCVIGEVRAVVSRKMPAFLGILEEFLEQDFIVRAPHRRGVLYL
jgi:predicted nucleic acid-binding protein